MDASLPEDLNLQGRSRLVKPPAWFMPAGSPKRQSGMTYVLTMESRGNLTASLAAAPAKICLPAEIRRDLTASDQECGGSNSESSMNADRNLLAGKMLKERLAEELGKLLPASEWSDIKLRAQSSYRQRNSERRISESGSSSLPTATTYPSGSGTASPAGRNSLETRLRSPAAISATLQGQLKLAAIVPGQSANPQIWGWMMGFPQNWCESVLIPQLGLLGLDDRDGGSATHRPIALELTASGSKGGGSASTITGLLVRQCKLYQWH